jgi:cell division inhibitor SepF
MNLFERLRDAFGLIDDYEEYDEYEDDEEELEPATPAQINSGRKLPNNVIGLPGLQMEVVLMQPRSFEEAPQAVTALRERKSVVLNLTMMEPEQAQRCADYVAGGVFAMDGHQRQLGPNIFLFTPNFVHITPHPAVETTTTVQQNPWVLPLSPSVQTGSSTPERR